MTAMVVGYVTCPFCGARATVHREARGLRALYFRCYDGPRGRCGTVQIRYEGGQAWIRENMVPLEGVELQEAEREAVGHARAEVQEVAREVKQARRATGGGPAGAGGIVGRMLSILGEDDV